MCLQSKVDYPGAVRFPAIFLALFFVSHGCNQASQTSGQPQAPRVPPKTEEVSPRSPQPEVSFETGGTPAKVTVEVVSTSALIQRGLMHRSHLPPDRGMLFVFGTEQVRTFWMKNTLIPLDMLFIREDMTVAGIVANAEPETLTQRTVGIPSRYVLEVNAGWAKEHNVTPGTTVRFEHVPPAHTPPL